MNNHSIDALSALFALVMVGCHPRPSVVVADARSSRSNADILRAALEVELDPLKESEFEALLAAVDDLAISMALHQIHPLPVADDFARLQRQFFSKAGFSPLANQVTPEVTSIASVLTNRRGSCVGLAIVYLALAHRLGLEAHALATPVHLFVRVRLQDGPRNVELMEGGQAIDDFTYRRHYRIDDASIASGAFMADLTNDQVIAHLLSNQAVVLSKQGKLDDALARYDKALRLHPKLVAAWYNRGIDLMNAGRFREALDSFNRALDLYPSDAQAHNNRGLAKAKLGDTDGARADFERALQLEPGMREAEENLRGLIRPN